MPTQNSKETKLKLLEAAKQEFAKNGFDATPVRNITEAAGVNVSAINYHFGSKEDLLEAILVNFSLKFKEQVKVLKEPSSSEEVRIRLEMYLQHCVDLSLSDLNSISVFYREQDKIMNQFIDAVAPAFMHTRKTLLEFIQSAMKKGLIRERNAEVLCNLFFSNLKGEVFDCELNQRLGASSIKDEVFREIWINESIDILWTAMKKEEVKND